MNATEAEPTQLGLYTLPADDHLVMIFRLRARREQIRKQGAEHFAQRQAIARRLNAAEAEFDDLMDGIGTPRRAADMIAAIRQAKDKRDRVRADMTTALEHQRTLKAALMRAQAEVELSIGGIQRTIVEDLGYVEPAHHATAQSLRTARHRATADASVLALRAMGGRASCVDLATLVGVSAHGLGGLIDADPRMRKTHDGRLQNVQTWYELTETA